MNKKLFFMNLLAVLLILGLMSNAWAYSYSYTDDGTYAPSYGGDNPINYSLNLTPTGADTYDAVFTITSNPEPGFSTASDWFGGWYAFKFSSNSTASIDNLIYPTAESWSVGDTSTQVLWSGGNTQSYLQDDFAGFHLDSLVSSTDIPTGGILLTDDYPGPHEYVFTFDLEVEDLFLPPQFGGTGIPFKAGLYDGLTGASNVQFNQLSETMVPEPSTMLLLGAGLMGLAFIGRKKFIKK
jgi:hypothetical protein